MGLIPGDRVACTVGTTELSGTYITDRDGMHVVKLDSGYNIGVDPRLVILLERGRPAEQPDMDVVQDPSLPELAIISTGGTIASRIDYRTGAVTSQFTAADILRAIPGLAEIARFRTHVLATILSENMTALWQEMARAVHDLIAENVAGDRDPWHRHHVVFYCGTRVHAPVPVPVVFVGSQRSMTAPKSTT